MEVLIPGSTVIDGIDPSSLIIGGDLLRTVLTAGEGPIAGRDRDHIDPQGAHVAGNVPVPDPVLAPGLAKGGAIDDTGKGGLPPLRLLAAPVVARGAGLEADIDDVIDAIMNGAIATILDGILGRAEIGDIVAAPPFQSSTHLQGMRVLTQG